MSRQPRAEATRERLLHATVEALAECGYRGTSTQEVCRRAQVSRGTLLHHFPTRIELLVAALDAILVERVKHFMASQRKLGRVKPEALIRALWTQWKEPVYVAWLELAVAARTEPALRDPMKEVMIRFDVEILAGFHQLVDTGHITKDLADLVPFLTFTIFNGLAITRGYAADENEEHIIMLMEHVGRMLPAARGLL